MAEQNMHIYKDGMYTFELFNCDLKQVLINMQLEINDLSATNKTFITKVEFESIFLGKPTEEPKLNHRFNTTLNQLVIQCEPSGRCI